MTFSRDQNRYIKNNYYVCKVNFKAFKYNNKLKTKKTKFWCPIYLANMHRCAQAYWETDGTLHTGRS